MKMLFTLRDYGGVVGNGTGAWQIGYRASKYSSNLPVTPSATNCAVTTGCATNVTTGAAAIGSRVQNAESAKTNTYALNWILNTNARVMFNYAETKFAHNIVILDGSNSVNALTGGTTDKERVISVRSQFNF